MHLAELRLRCRSDGFEAAVARRQQLGDALADEPDAERVEQAGQTRSRDARWPGLEILGRLLRRNRSSAPISAPSACRGRRNSFTRPVSTSLLDRAVAQVLDVHRPPRPEVTQPLLELGGQALLVQRQYGFTVGRKATPPHAGHWDGKVNGWVSAGRLASTTDDVRDHVARALDQDGVAHAGCPSPDLVLVVQADVADGHSGQLDGESLAVGVKRARLAHVHLDRLDHGRGLASANLNAIAQRGWWVVEPSRRWCSRASTLTTTPSAS